MPSIRHPALLAAAALVATAAASPAAAAVATEETLIDAVNGVTVIERFDGFAGGTFEVFNNSGQDILLFAVSNPNNDPGANTTRPGWTGSAIEKEDWNSPLNGIETFSLANGEVFSVDAGSFESFFGDSDQSALVYHNNGAFNPISPGEQGQDPLEFSFFTIAVTSDFIAVDTTGQVFSGSFSAAAVPLPATFPLLGGAFAGLYFLGRRRRR